MADENKTAYASREWHTGDVITADALNKIENEMEYVSEEVTNAVTGTINDQKLNDTLARKLDSVVKYFPNTPNPDTDLEYVRMYAQPSTEGTIIVPTEEEYLRFKQNFVQPFTNKAYTAGSYVEYEDEIYKVRSAIAKNNSAADDATAWAAILAQNPSPVGKINPMEELNNLINVYTSDSQLTPEQNRIWIQQPGESVEVPSYEEFSDLKSALIQDEIQHIKLESGTFDDNTGNKSNYMGNTRIRTCSLVPINDINSITIPTGYSAWFYRFSNNQSFISYLSGWKSGKMAINDIITTNTAYINILFRNNSAPSANISEQVSTVENSLLVERKFDTTINDLTTVINSKVNDYVETEFINENKRVTETGNIVNSTGHYCTNRIPCQAGQRVSCMARSQFYNGETITSLIAFFNENNEMLSNVTKIGNETAATFGYVEAIAPENTAYTMGTTTTGMLSQSYFRVHQTNVVGKLNENTAKINVLEKTIDSVTFLNTIKYDWFGKTSNIIAGTYASSDGSIIDHSERIRNNGIVHVDNSAYIIFIPGTKINSFCVAKRQNGESTFTETSYYDFAHIVTINADTDIILVFRSLKNGLTQVINPSDYDAICYIATTDKLIDYKNQCYCNTLNYYAYQDNARIFSEGGAITFDNNWVISAYIPVTAGTKYIYHSGNDNALAYMVFYDSAKTRMIAYSNSMKPRIIEVPSDATFMRVSVSKDDNGKIMSTDGKTIFAWNAIGQVNAGNEVIPDNDYEVMPEDWPHEVGYRRSQQFTNIKWTPKYNVPRSLVHGGEGYFPANVERTGMLYSDVFGTNKIIGYDVSIKTFMTAVNNPYSLLYTENCNPSRSQSAYSITYTYGDIDTAAYFGTACNNFAMWAIGSPIPYFTFDLYNHAEDYNLPFERIYDQSANGLQLLDLLVTSGHMLLVTRLWKTKRGVVTRIGVSEAGQDGAQNSYIYTADGFNTFIKNANYDIFRYTELYKNIHYESSPFVAIENETITPYVYNDDICTFAGDYACFAEGDLLHINYTKGSYTQMEIYKDNTLLETITLDSSADVHDVNLTPKNYTYGKYKARLKNGNTYSDFTYWEIINATISITGNTLSFSTANSTPFYWQWMRTDGYHYKRVMVTDAEIASGEIDVSDKATGYTQMKVVFKGDYGNIARIIV